MTGAPPVLLETPQRPGDALSHLLDSMYFGLPPGDWRRREVQSLRATSSS